jgi:glycine cleavage system aminomethyltransferase T
LTPTTLFLNSAMKNAVAYPRQENQSARKLRTSPLYTVLAESGAWFGEKNGFERAMYFRDPEEAPYADSAHKRSTLTFHKPGWFETVETEYWACRESVAMIDMSAFTKFEIKVGAHHFASVNYLFFQDILKCGY